LNDEARAVARVLVFSGHRIDAPGRESPRFPSGAAQQAAELIGAAVRHEQDLAVGAPVVGFAGGASGGDILFHETCEQLGIPTTMMLALPPRAFAIRSVADAGPEWAARFERLCNTHPARVLAAAADDPESDDVWQRANVWILETALAVGAGANTLIALWDGKGGDGPGGTEAMVHAATERGFGVVCLDAGPLAQHAPPAPSAQPRP
jgi:hypothetical protein